MEAAIPSEMLVYIYKLKRVTQDSKNIVLYQYTEIKYVKYTENILGRMTTFKKGVTVKVSEAMRASFLSWEKNF